MIFQQLNTFIQLLAALYVTIAFDDIIFHRFWAPNLLTSTKKILKKYDLSDNKFLEEKLYPAIEKRFLVLESNSRKRGFVNVYVCLLFLVYNAFLYIEDFRGSQFPFLIFSSSLVIDYAIMVLTSVWCKRWRWFILCIVLFFITNCLGIYLATKDYLSAPSILSLSDLSKLLFVVAGLLIPVLFQLGQSWMYSEGYRHYLDAEVHKESILFKQAKKAKEEHNDDLMPEVYKPYFATTKERRTSDFLMTQLNKGLCERLEKICCKFTIVDIIKSIFKSSETEIVASSQIRLSDEDEGIDGGKKHEVDYDRWVHLYDNQKSRPKIEDFCKMNGLDEDLFRQYRRQKKSKGVSV